MNDCITYLIGVVLGFLIGAALCFYTSVEPLQQEAIKRGYASYTISTTTNQSTSQFTWK